MLVALHQNIRVEASSAARGLVYICPNPECNGVLILKKGRKRIAHFAHKPPVHCSWARGETQAHLRAKQVVYEAVLARNLRAQLECIVATLPRDRRADVMAWSASGQSLAFELQHTSIDLDEIEARAASYARAGIAQFWIPFLSKSVWSAAEPRGDGVLFVEKYPARPFEKWVHGLHGNDGMWVYSPWDERFWHARLAGHQIYVEERSWFEPGGIERSEGGFHRWSKRYRELTLRGPYPIEKLQIKVSARSEHRVTGYFWPAAKVASFSAG